MIMDFLMRFFCTHYYYDIGWDKRTGKKKLECNHCGKVILVKPENCKGLSNG